MCKLYIANKNYSSWSLRAWLLMRELGLTFEEEIFPFTEDSWEVYKKRCPGGLVPWLWWGSCITTAVMKHLISGVVGRKMEMAVCGSFLNSTMMKQGCGKSGLMDVMYGSL